MNKKTTMLLVAGGGVALIALIYIYKKQSAANASTAATNPGIDPATGIPYADEQGAYSSPYGTTPSLYGYTDPSTGAFITGTGAGSTVTQPSTNASWAQEVEAYMQNLGYDPTAVAAALGKYLVGGTLTADQQSIVQAALGFFGNPPNGAPPVSTGAGGGTGQGGGSGGGKPPKMHPGEWVPLGGKLQAWWSANKSTLAKVPIDLSKSGWYHIDGKKVYYSKDHNTFGYYIGKKWTTEKVT
ncbi:MAG: hypothetical protein ACREBW_10270 [Candidatus Micrarchaeaceae archaeon]